MNEKRTKKVRLSKKDKIKASMDKLNGMWQFQAFIKEVSNGYKTKL